MLNDGSDLGKPRRRRAVASARKRLSGLVKGTFARGHSLTPAYVKSKIIIRWITCLSGAASGMSRRGGQLLVVALLVLAANLAGGPAVLASTLMVGDLPPQKLTWQVKLSDYRGKIVIISFWASWCPPCRKELHILAAIQKEATRDKLIVFAVNWREDEDRFWQISRALSGLGLTLLSDSAGHIGRQYDVNAIAAIHIGYGDSEIPILVNEIS